MTSSYCPGLQACSVHWASEILVMNAQQLLTWTPAAHRQKPAQSIVIVAA